MSLELIFGGGFPGIVSRLLKFLPADAIEQLYVASPVLETGLRQCRWDVYMSTRLVMSWCPVVCKVPRFELMVYPILCWMAARVDPAGREALRPSLEFFWKIRDWEPDVLRSKLSEVSESFKALLTGEAVQPASFFVDYDVSVIRSELLDASFHSFGGAFVNAVMPCFPCAGKVPWKVGGGWEPDLCERCVSIALGGGVHDCFDNFGPCQRWRNLFSKGSPPPVLSFYLLCHYFRVHLRVGVLDLSVEPTSFLIYVFIYCTSFTEVLKTYFLPYL